MGLHIKNGVHYGSGPSKAEQLPIIDTEGVIGTAGSTTNTQLLVDALADVKQDKDIILTTTLTAGQTSVTFTNAAITATALLDIYTDTYGVNPRGVTISGTTATITFKQQANNVSVRLVIH